MKNFSNLTEQELLALAIALEEEDSRTYSDLADAMRESHPGTARMFAAMAAEEDGHVTASSTARSSATTSR
jgi:rubrerythrin